MTPFWAREVLNWRLGVLKKHVSFSDWYWIGRRDYILSECTAIDSPHGDAERTGLKDVVVGEAFNELY